jgi:hypothetical protein
MNIQRTILRNLDQRPNGMCPTGTLWADVSQDEPGTSYSEFKRALAALEEASEVTVINGKDRAKVFLTDAGRARLMEQ